MNQPFPGAAPAALTPEQMRSQAANEIRGKLTFAGRAVVGREDEVDWLIANLSFIKNLPPEQKLQHLLGWLATITTYELDDNLRAQQATQPPANPISDATTPQQAAPAPAPEKPVKEKKAKAEKEADEPEAEYKPLKCPQCGDKASSLRGLKRHVTMTHKATWADWCKLYLVNPETGELTNGAAAAPAAQPQAGAPPQSPAIPPLVGQAPSAVVAPQAMPTPTAAPLSPVGFVPTAAPTAPPAPITPMFQPEPTPPTALPVPPAPAMVQPPILATIPSQNGLPQPVAQVQPGTMHRSELAQALGGAVEALYVKVLDAIHIDRSQYWDANQLSLLAEQSARNELRIIDLAAGAYGAGKQAAQRHFAQLLTQYPRVVVYWNGYEPVLGKDYIDILSARLTKVTTFGDKGNNPITVSL